MRNTFLGKNIGVYKSDKTYSLDDLKGFLKRFQLHNALRLIGELSYSVSKNKVDQDLQRFPITNSLLSYMAMLLIENSNDYRAKEMTDADVLKACNIYYGLTDPISTNHDATEFLVRCAFEQFPYQRANYHLLSRSLIIYSELWSTVNEAQHIDIEDEIIKLVGLEYHEILFFSLAFSEQAKKGFIRLYEDHKNQHIIEIFFTKNKQDKFVNWLSCSYDEFRLMSRADNPPDTLYDKHRFNSLINKPLIIPDRNPKPGDRQVYILPINRFLFEKVTRGMYYLLADKFKTEGSKKNSFRTAFGYVFQEYIGRLLRKACCRFNILKEWEYSKPEKKTIDWIAMDETKVIFFEVKQSALYIESKKWGRIEDIQKDLGQTIAAGVKQLWLFEKAVNSGKYESLNILKGKEFEKVIITFDRAYYVNSVLRTEVKKILEQEIDDLPANFHWHVISIDEFEYFAGSIGDSMFEILKAKRLNDSTDELDFWEYLCQIQDDNKFTNNYLNEHWDTFFRKYGL